MSESDTEVTVSNDNRNEDENENKIENVASNISFTSKRKRGESTPVQIGLAKKKHYLKSTSFYLGKKDNEDIDGSVTQTAVLKLLERLSGKNHRLYMENYSTSIQLFPKLLKMDIYIFNWNHPD
jgi:GH15 family glucan-1,4-alpha-glucosidase